MCSAAQAESAGMRMDIDDSPAASSSSHLKPYEARKSDPLSSSIHSPSHHDYSPYSRWQEESYPGNRAEHVRSRGFQSPKRDRPYHTLTHDHNTRRWSGDHGVLEYEHRYKSEGAFSGAASPPGPSHHYRHRSSSNQRLPPIDSPYLRESRRDPYREPELRPLGSIKLRPLTHYHHRSESPPPPAVPAPAHRSAPLGTAPPRGLPRFKWDLRPLASSSVESSEHDCPSPRIPPIRTLSSSFPSKSYHSSKMHNLGMSRELSAASASSSKSIISAPDSNRPRAASQTSHESHTPSTGGSRPESNLDTNPDGNVTEPEMDESGGGGGATTGERRKKKRTRVLMTSTQQQRLYQLWKQTKFPTSEQRDQMAQNIGLTPRQVQVWFQNQRQKFRKQLNETGGVPPGDDPRNYTDLTLSPNATRDSLDAQDRTSAWASYQSDTPGSGFSGSQGGQHRKGSRDQARIVHPSPHHLSPSDMGRFEVTSSVYDEKYSPKKGRFDALDTPRSSFWDTRATEERMRMRQAARWDPDMLPGIRDAESENPRPSTAPSPRRGTDSLDDRSPHTRSPPSTTSEIPPPSHLPPELVKLAITRPLDSPLKRPNPDALRVEPLFTPDLNRDRSLSSPGDAERGAAGEEVAVPMDVDPRSPELSTMRPRKDSSGLPSLTSMFR